MDGERWTARSSGLDLTSAGDQSLAQESTQTYAPDSTQMRAQDTARAHTHSATSPDLPAVPHSARCELVTIRQMTAGHAKLERGWSTETRPERRRSSARSRRGSEARGRMP
eukprot:2813482-Rhodomonas_salina.1